MFKNLVLRAACVIAVAQGCAKTMTAPAACVAPGGQYTFSFEQGLEGWTPVGADTGSPGSAYAPWSVGPTTELVCTGQRSLKFQVNNSTDAAKIWIVRAFAADSGRTYTVDVSYAFGTEDYGTANHFVLLTGAAPTAPVDGPSLLAATLHDDTGSGANSSGYVWLRKSVQMSANGNASGLIYVVIGVWGTFEVARTYYVDNVAVTLTPQ